MQEWYSGGHYSPKSVSKKQIQEMVKNMKKSKVVSERSRQFHKKEEIEAEDILKRLNER